jgi:hypothetical protein
MSTRERSAPGRDAVAARARAPVNPARPPQGVTRGGAAARSGRNRRGDVLLAVDREATGGAPPGRLLRRLCGPAGTPVELLLARGLPPGETGGGGAEWTVVLRREAMPYSVPAGAGWPTMLEAL